MADLIDRQALIAEHCDGCKYLANGLCNHDVCGSVELMMEAPAVDAELVVRCKDCKKNPNFLKTSGKHMVWCRKWRCEVKDDGFCSYGERRASDG